MFDDLSPEWLLTGGGEMLKKEHESVVQVDGVSGIASLFEKLNSRNEELVRENERLKIELEQMKSKQHSLPGNDNIPNHSVGKKIKVTH